MSVRRLTISRMRSSRRGSPRRTSRYTSSARRLRLSRPGSKRFWRSCWKMTRLRDRHERPAAGGLVSEWQKVALGDLLEVEHGFAFKGEYFVASGTDVLLTPKNFRPEGGL